MNINSGLDFLKIEIPNFIFTIIIGIFSIAIGLLYDKGGLTDLRHRKILTMITKRGWIVISLTGFSILLGLLQENIKSAKDQEKDNELMNNNKKRDSILALKIRSGVDSNSKNLFDIMSIAFKNEGLKLDTLNKKILIFKDSERITINNINQKTNSPPPYLIIDTNGIYLKSKNEYESIYNIRISSYVASSTNFNIKWKECIILNNNNLKVLKDNLIDKDLIIGMNSSFICEFKITSNEVKYIYLYGKGTYSSLEESKKYKFDELYEYNVKENYTNVISGPTKKSLLNDLNEK